MLLNSIFKNTFAAVFVVMVTAFIMMILALYFFLPNFYYDFKELGVNQTLSVISGAIIKDEEPYEDIIRSSDSEVDYVFLMTDEKEIIYPDETRLSYIQYDNNVEDIYRLLDDNINQIQGETSVPCGDETCSLIAVSLLSRVDEVVESVLLMIPFLIIGAFILSFFFALLIARNLSVPLIKLNKKAGAIANLDFNSQIKIKRADELGQLSDNLDIVNINLREAMDELQNDVKIAKKKEQDRRMFMSTISHELKTPLTILKGQCECMIDGIGPYVDHDKYLNENIRIVDDLEKLVNNILVSSKVDDTDIKIQRQAVELDEFILDTISDLEQAFETKKLEVICKLDKVIIDVDPSLFKLAIKNIIENAFKYANNNTKVFVTLSENNLEVVNQSNVILDVNMDDLFQPFKTSDDSRNSKTGGHGLGLYIIKKVLEIHNFDFSFIKEVNTVTFTIDFKKGNDENITS